MTSETFTVKEDAFYTSTYDLLLKNDEVYVAQEGVADKVHLWDASGGEFSRRYLGYIKRAEFNKNFHIGEEE